MWDTDRWNEIWEALSKNKLRSVLTAFGVFWGIFMLMIMMGSGEGLRNGVQRDFGNRATNSMNLWAMRTSMPYGGFQRGRFVELKSSDVQVLYNQVDGIDTIAPRNRLGGWRGSNNVVRKDKTGAFNVYGDYPQYILIDPKIISQGRYINNYDIEEKRKVAVIGQKVSEILYEPGEDPIGTFIQINGVNFQVVGVFESMLSGNQAEEETQTVFIPFTTFQQAFNYGDRIGWMSLTAKENYDIAKIEQDVLTELKKIHHVHPNDERAFGSWNLKERFEQMNNLFNGIKYLALFVGLLTLLAGAIGISNIMLVVVKERTKEIGIRRALGATPWSIVSQILMEALVLTTLAGILGMLAGVWIMEGINTYLETSQMDSGSFRNPEIELGIVVIALIILIISGLIAGIIPARRAIRIKPVDAIRDE
jgi:putative ABC transport system permease protein